MDHLTYIVATQRQADLRRAARRAGRARSFTRRITHTGPRPAVR